MLKYFFIITLMTCKYQEFEYYKYLIIQELLTLVPLFELLWNNQVGIQLMGGI